MAAAEEGQYPRKTCGLMIRQLLLVMEMLGVEACVTFQLILMIANLQTLGVPIRYASFPLTFSTIVSVILIPALGYLLDNKANSKSGKAKVLIFASSLQLIGVLIVFASNMIKLLYFDDVLVTGRNDSTTWTALESVGNFTNTSASVARSPFYYNMETTGFNSDSLSEAVVNGSSTVPSLPLTAVVDSTSTHATVVPRSTGESSIPWYAIMAMVGFSIFDVGSDSANCFLKTFALECSSPSDHASILVKALFMSSLGGCLITILSSFGLGHALTAGTDHDSNSAQCALLSALAFVIHFCGLITTLTTGFCCPPSSYYSKLEEIQSPPLSAADEKSNLVLTKDVPSDVMLSEQALYPSYESSGTVTNNASDGVGRQKSISCENHNSDKNETVDHCEKSARTGIIGFVTRQKKQILVCVSTFFLLGGNYSFETFALNFVGEGIYNGNPSAEINSDAYNRYLLGIQIGSVGTLIYFIVFTVTTVFQEMLLDKLGWKLEVLIACVVDVTVNLICALTATLWSFYITAVWTGVFRGVVLSVPYILANKFVWEEGNGKNSGIVLAAVSAMLPLSFTLCSAVMGPMIDVTGNSATPVYYTAVSAFLGMVVICFLKDN